MHPERTDSRSHPLPTVEPFPSDQQPRCSAGLPGALLSLNDFTFQPPLPLLGVWPLGERSGSLVPGLRGLTKTPEGRIWGRLNSGGFQRTHFAWGVVCLRPLRADAWTLLSAASPSLFQVQQLKTTATLGALIGNRSSECSPHPRAVCIAFRL